MRKLLILIASLPLLLLAYVGGLHLLPDEELEPGAVVWLQHRGEAVADEQNSYYLMWGLDAPADVSMRKYGEAKVEKIIQVEASGTGRDNDYSPDGYGNSILLQATGMDDLCESHEVYCLDEYRKAIPRLLAAGDNGLLVQRYRELSALPYYRRTAPVGLYTPYPSFSLLRNAQRLQLASIGSRYLQGEKQGALADLAADLRFTRLLLAEADSLITRMIAIYMMAEDLHCYSQLLEVEKQSDAVLQAVNGITELRDDERDYEAVMVTELQFSYQALVSLETDSAKEDVWTRLLFGSLPLRKNRMVNRVYHQLKMAVDMVSLPPSAVVKQGDKFMQELTRGPSRWDYISDPVTAVLLGIVTPDYTSYLLRHYDLNGLIRLLKVKALLKANAVPEAEIDAFIASSPYASAYGEEMIAISWESGIQALRYTPAVENSLHSLEQIIFLTRERATH